MRSNETFSESPDPQPGVELRKRFFTHGDKEYPHYHQWLKKLTGISVQRNKRRMQPDPEHVSPSGTMEDLRIIQSHLIEEVLIQRPIWEEFRAATEKRELKPVRLPSEVWNKVAVAYSGLTYVWNPRLELLLRPTIFHKS